GPALLGAEERVEADLEPAPADRTAALLLMLGERLAEDLDRARERAVLDPVGADRRVPLHVDRGDERYREDEGNHYAASLASAAIAFNGGRERPRASSGALMSPRTSRSTTGQTSGRRASVKTVRGKRSSASFAPQDAPASGPTAR